MDWTRYFRRYRRFERHSVKEIALQRLLPDDWSKSVSLEQIEHERFSLSGPDAYFDIASKYAYQEGAIEGFMIENGVLWPAVGGIRTYSGKLVRESFFDENSFRFATEKGYIRRFPTIEAPGPAATLGHVYRNYYHRWSDSISRIFALHHPWIEALDGIHVYIDGRFTDGELKVIRYLLPDYAELVVTASAVRVAAPKCIHLPYLSSDRTGYSEWFNASAGFLPTACLDWLRNGVYSALEIEPGEPRRRVYVTRRHAKLRRLINEDEVCSYLRDRGFEVVALERRPLRSQVKLFAEADIIVAQHGAGLTNLLFAQSPRVLEILSDDDRQIFFSLISKSRGFDHTQLTMGGDNKNDDVYLPIDRLHSWLESVQDTCRRV